MRELGIREKLDNNVPDDHTNYPVSNYGIPCSTSAAQTRTPRPDPIEKSSFSKSVLSETSYSAPTTQTVGPKVEFF